MTGDGLLIVIPCLNEETHLPDLLEQFVVENPDALIVVADGGSTDRSCEIVSKRATDIPNLVLLENPSRTQAAGVNLAVSRHGADREWLLRIDAHCQYPSDYASRLLEIALERRASCVVIPMVTRGKSCFQTAVAAAQNSVLGTGGSPHRHVGLGSFVDHGHHALMPIELFRNANGYREDMVANEDAELDHRFIKRGAQIWLEPSLALTYFPRANPAALWRQYFNYGRGRARTLLMHRVRPKPRQVLPVAVPAAMISMALAPFSLWFAAPAAIWLSLLIAAGLIIGVRERAPCALLSGAAAGIMHLAWGLGFLLEALNRNGAVSAASGQTGASCTADPVACEAGDRPDAGR
jgi:succinoglycan biosynthesis protein ExoA